MGTIQQDIHDLHSALDFFAGYATQEETVPADYEVMLLHAGVVKLRDALNFARTKIGTHLQPTEIDSLPLHHRAAAVLWFVHTFSNRKGDALARVWASLQTYPPEMLPAKFSNAGRINEWVQEGAPPWSTPKAATGAPALLDTNRFGISEGDGVVLVTAFDTRISPDEALNLAAHLEVAATHTGGSPRPFAQFLEAAKANLGHPPETPTPPPAKVKKARKKTTRGKK